MAYVDQNFKTKTAFKKAVAAGEAVFVQKNAFGGSGCYKPGKAAVEGPHFPQAHSWYADCDVDDSGKVTKVR